METKNNNKSLEKKEIFVRKKEVEFVFRNRQKLYLRK